MIPRPPIAPPPPWAFPLPEITTLEAGLAVWAYDLPGQLILACDLVMELPLDAEPADREGVATIAVRCLDEGTLAHPGQEFALALEDAGAQFSGHIGLSTAQCLLGLPYDSLDAGLALLAEAASAPAYDEADVARIKANRLSEIEQQESRGSYVASSALRRAVLDETLRIARPLGGTQEGVAAIQPADVAAFHARHYRAREATLIIAGDLSGIDAADAAARAFAGWNPDTEPVRPVPAAPGAGGRTLIHRDGAVQADVRFGWYGIDRRDPRWAGLQVALTIMGGSFDSRLNTVLREERGFTYGVSMNAHPFRHGGMIDISTATRTEAAPDLIEETLRILEAAEPFSEAEVAGAIGYLTMSAPLSLDTAEAIASQAATLAAGRLDLDHVTTSLADLARVTPASAMDAYRSLVDPGTASIVVVADRGELGELSL